MTPTLQRFVKYFAVGASTFLFDLAMLFIAVHFFKIPYYIATPCTFLIAVTCNYLISRKLVFTGTERGLYRGYANFAAVALFAAFITTSLVGGLVSLFGLYYLAARILVAGIVGMGNYLFNLYINFKVVGKH